VNPPGGSGPRAGEFPALLKRFGIEPRRGLSQNFLVNDGASAAIAAACGPDGRHVVEIGAGPGVLTRMLAARAARVTAFEIDERFRPLHEAHPFPPNVDLRYGDFLAADLGEILADGGPAVVAGNIPYAVTGLVFRRALHPRLPVERVCLLVQEEVARRVVARTGRDHGILSTAAWLFGEARIALLVRAGSFHPAPRVRSAAVVVDRAPRDLGGADPERFMAFVRRAFSGRRKTLANTAGGDDPALRDLVRRALAAFGRPEDARPESLDPASLLELYRAVAAALPAGAGGEGEAS